MRVRLNGNGVRTILGIGPMAHHAHFVDGLAQHGVVVSTVRIVAAETGDTAGVHQALDEIIALHAVLVRGTVGEVRKSRFAQSVRL